MKSPSGYLGAAFVRNKPAGVVILALGTILVVFRLSQAGPANAATSRFSGPTNSQSLALTADDAFLAAVNPDNNTVSFFDTRSDVNRKLAEVPVQVEPNGVAMMPDGLKAYVANTVSGTVTVIPLNIRNGIISRPSKHIVVGTEPYGVGAHTQRQETLRLKFPLGFRVGHRYHYRHGDQDHFRRRSGTARPCNYQ